MTFTRKVSDFGYTLLHTISAIQFTDQTHSPYVTFKKSRMPIYSTFTTTASYTKGEKQLGEAPCFFYNAFSHKPFSEMEFSVPTIHNINTKQQFNSQ